MTVMPIAEGIPMPEKIQRLFAEPLDMTEVHPSRAVAEAYAAGNPTAYAGQIVAFRENGREKAAIVQPDKSLNALVDSKDYNALKNEIAILNRKILCRCR